MNESQASNEIQRLYAEQVRQIYKHAPIGIIANLVNSLILSFILWKVIPHSTLIIWFSVIISISLLRYLLCFKYGHSSQTPDDAGGWERWFLVTLTFSGVVWGSAGIFLFPIDSIAHQTFIAFVLGGMVAGAAGSLSVIIRFFLAYSLPALIPIIIRFFMIGDNIHLAMGGMILLFGLLMFSTAKRINAVTISSLKLQFENRDLINHLVAEKGRIEKLNKDYKFEIAERKHAQDELRKAKDSAEAANKAKTDFLANMSHELRTPLNHIIGFTELVLDKNFGDLNEAQEEYLKDVHSSSKHLLSLINDILDLSKVEAGKLELEPSDVELKTLLEHSITMFKETAVNHGIKLSYNADSIPDIIRADERKLKQALYNLLSNSVKFTPDGGEVSLRARVVDCIVRPGLRRGDSEGLKIVEDRVEDQAMMGTLRKKCVECSVSDTGIGIKPEDQKLIFEPFEQVDGSLSKRYEGAGLGLPLTRKLVELHGGKIWVESEGEGKGSTFRFVIPT